MLAALKNRSRMVSKASNSRTEGDAKYKPSHPNPTNRNFTRWSVLKFCGYRFARAALLPLHMASTNAKSLPLMSYEGAAALTVKYLYSGVLGDPKGKDVGYSFIEETEDSFSFVFIAGLEDDTQQTPVDRYRIVVDRRYGIIEKPELISLSDLELARAILIATGLQMAEATRFPDGAMSVSYKISIKNDPDTLFMLQIRHIGDMHSICETIRMISSITDPSVLPIPAAYPLDQKWVDRYFPGKKLQITKFIPGGVMAYLAYPEMSHEQRLRFVRNFARAFDSLWNIELPNDTMIGGITATRQGDVTKLSVGSNRQHDIDGPQASVSDFLRAYIRQRVEALDKVPSEEGLDVFKAKYLQPLKSFVESGMPNIPSIVEQVPVVLAHSDMGIHNVIVSAKDPTEIRAIIDWEFVATYPFVWLEHLFENLFRPSSVNGKGPEYPGAAELRKAFWQSMPKWNALKDSEAAQVFREWYRFGMLLKPEPWIEDLSEDGKKSHLAENIKVVEQVLAKWPQWPECKRTRKELYI